MTTLEKIARGIQQPIIQRVPAFAHLPLRTTTGWVWWRPVWICFDPRMPMGGLFTPTHWYERSR